MKQGGSRVDEIRLYSQEEIDRLRGPVVLIDGMAFTEVRSISWDEGGAWGIHNFCCVTGRRADSGTIYGTPTSMTPAEVGAACAEAGVSCPPEYSYVADTHGLRLLDGLIEALETEPEASREA